LQAYLIHFHNECVQTHITTEIGHQNSILILQFISFRDLSVRRAIATAPVGVRQ